MWQGGLTYHEIAMALHCSRSTVAGHIYRHRAGMGVAVPRAPKPPSKPKRRRDRTRTRGPNLATDPNTHAVVEAISASRWYDVEIAERAGLNPVTIRRWRNGTHSGRRFELECVREALTATER